MTTHIPSAASDAAPITQAQYRRLVENYDDMARKLERLIQLVDELGAALGLSSLERH